MKQAHTVSTSFAKQLYPLNASPRYSWSSKHYKCREKDPRFESANITPQTPQSILSWQKHMIQALWTSTDIKTQAEYRKILSITQHTISPRPQVTEPIKAKLRKAISFIATMPTTPISKMSDPKPSPRRNALTLEHPAHDHPNDNVSYSADHGCGRGNSHGGEPDEREAPKPKPIGPPRPERPYPWVG
ncbi:MAG: hypothetical protein Q9198_006801 [Flavoplaca austrocitrina]